MTEIEKITKEALQEIKEGKTTDWEDEIKKPINRRKLNKLERLAKKALKDYKEGKTTPFPPN